MAALAGGVAGAPFSSEVPPRFGVDGLTGVMLLLVGVVAAAAMLAGAETLRAPASGGLVAALGGGFVLALAGVVTARTPVAFLACWEAMTLLPAVATLAGGATPLRRRVMFEYLAITHIGGVGVWVAILLIADRGALGGVPLPPDGATAALVAVAAIIGFGTKAGLVPLHAWLPRAHPVAPSHLSAVMSGAMVATAVYGLIRVETAWTVPPQWVGPVLMLAGAASAAWGILCAVGEGELKRMLACSTVENMGIAVAAVGAGVWLAHEGRPQAAALAFGAALLQLLVHAAAKGALFLTAGGIIDATGEHDLDRLGGLLRRMPVTGAVVGLSALTLAAVPPTAGFVAEWGVLQGVLAAARTDVAAAASAAGVALVLLAATAGLAAIAMTTLAGLTLLGPPRSEGAAAASDPSRAALAGPAALAAALIALVAGAAWLLPALGGVVLPGADAGDGGFGLLKVPGTGGLAPLGILVLLAALTWGLGRLRGPSAAPAPIWLCGQPPLARSPWTAAGFTKTLRIALDGVVRSEREVVVEREGGVVQGVHSSGEVPDLAARWVYGPMRTGALTGARYARRLQGGSLRLYIGYLLALVLVGLALLKLGWLG